MIIYLLILFVLLIVLLRVVWILRVLFFIPFSDFVVEREVFYDDFVVSLDGIVSVVISSVDELFIRDFISFLFGHDLFYKNNALSLFKFEFMENVSFTSGVAGFISRAPICLKKDLFGDDLFSRLGVVVG